MKNKFFITFTALWLLAFPSYVNAQVFSQSQVIIRPYGIGVIVSTSTANGSKLEASSSPSLTSIYATSTTATSSIAHLSVAQLAIGSLSGILKSVGGYVQATLVNLASDVTGILPIINGGTGTSTAPVGQLIYGGTSAYQSVATTSVTCSGSTTCSAFVAIGNSPITISSSGITALGPLGQTQTGATQTLASSTDSTTGLTSGITITATGNVQTFKPTLSGFLNPSFGGTGTSTLPGYGKVLVGNLAGTGYDYVATSTFGSGSASLTGTQGQVAYFSGTNTAVGTSTLFITQPGAIGINTLTPSAQLDVSGTTTTSAAQALDIWNSANTNLLRVRNDGRVGISTTSPGSTLDIHGNISADNIGGPLTYSVIGSSNVNGSVPNSVENLFVGEQTTGATRALFVIAASNASVTSVVQGFNAQAMWNGTVNNTGGTTQGGGVRNRIVVTNTAAGLNVTQMSGLTLQVSVTGTLASSTNGTNFHSEVPSVSAGDLLTNSRGFWQRNNAVAGTVTNAIGANIESLTFGTNNTELLLGTPTAPTGNYSLYQGDSYSNYLAGNTGIGSTSPGSLFSIGNSGWNFFDNATTTKSGTGGINITDGCYAKNGTCISGGGGASYTATWPITLTGTAFGFNGLSTSTAAVIGNIPYFSGVNTFANVATTTLTGNNGLTLSAGTGALIGGSNATIGLAAIAANSVLGNITGASAVPSAVATTSLFTGTTGQNAYFSGTGAIVGTSTIFTSSASNVGIGTTTPTSLLTVAANALGGLLITTWTNITNAFTVTNATGATVFNIDTTAASPFLGIGTTTPWATLSVIGNGTNPIFAVATTTNNGLPNFEIDTTGHVITSGPKPAISGGTSTVVGNDNNGTITVIGTLLTSVTITFANAWATAPDCTMSDNSTGITADISSISTTQIVFGFSTGINSGTVWYQCRGHQ